MALNGKENAESRRAMHLERDLLGKMDCWDIDDRLNDRKVMHTKFVLKRKKGEKGNVKRYKARLVVCSNEDLDYYEDSFSPVANFTIVKLMIYIGL